MSSSNKLPLADYRLKNINNALYVDGNDDIVMRTGFVGNIVISGNVNVPGTIHVDSSPDSPVHVHLTELGTFGNLTTYVPVRGNVTVDNFPAFPSNVSITSLPGIAVTNFPAFPSNISITQMPGITGSVTVSGNVGIAQMPAITGNVNIADGGNSITVDGNVSITQMPAVSIVGNVTTIPSPTVATLVKFIDSTNTQLDMTERLRVAPPTQSWWYAPAVDKDGDLRYIEAFVGANAQSVFVQNLATVQMSSGTDANGSAIRISRRRHKMRPGVSIQYLTSLSFHGKRTNVTKRAGMFTNYNGIFYEVTDDLYIVIRRRLTDGTLVEQRVARSDFTLDRLDGTGPTGYNFTTTTTANLTQCYGTANVTINATTGNYVYRTIYACDNTAAFEVGTRVGISGVTPKTYNVAAMITAKTAANLTVTYATDPGAYSSISSATAVQTAFHKQYVYGFEISGSRTTGIRFFMDTVAGHIPIHIEDFSGELSTTFENAPALSTRYEITNTGTTVGAAAMSLSSEVVNVEAEVELNPGFGTADNLAHPVTFIKQNAGTEWAIMAVGLRAGEPYQRADIQLQSIQIADKSNINPQNSGLWHWRLVLNPTVVGYTPTPTNVGKASRKWEFTGNSTITGGTELLSGFSSSVSTIDTRTALNFINLGSNIEYTDADKIYLSVQQVTGGTDNGSIVAIMNFIESL